MYQEFDYEAAINKIKSALFDIYENQEIIVGSILDDSQKNSHLQEYIETKNSALLLIEKLNDLYGKKETKLSQIIKNNEEQAQPIEETTDEVEEDTEPTVEESTEDVEEQAQPIEETTDEVEEDTEPIVEGSTEDVEEQAQPIEETTDEVEEDIESTVDDARVISIEDVETDDNDETTFYLDSRNGDKPNFAYVPERLYTKIKLNNNTNTNTLEDDNIFYKQDNNKEKGIIVRNDQYMKLSLSRHRQEGVISEAREYRIMQAKKSREKYQEEYISKENAKEKIKLNI